MGQMKIALFCTVSCAAVLANAGQVKAAVASEQATTGGSDASARSSVNPSVVLPEDGQAKGAAAASADYAIEDIVVTAQRRSESLQSVPLAVSAIGGAALERSGTNLQLALPRVVPSLRINENSGFVSPYIRGVGTEYANPGLESSVATYLDDIYVARPYFTLSSFADLDRVEVLKGPQGTLYGRNASGGVLRILTHDPVDTFEARASAAYGRFDRVALDGVVNIPIAENIASRFSASYDRNDGYVDSIIPGAPKGQNRDYFFATGKLLITPTDNLRIKLAADYSHKLDYEGQGWVGLTNEAPGQTGIVLGGQRSPGFYTTSSNYYGERGGNLSILYGGSARIDLDLPGITLSSISGYRYLKNQAASDLDVTSANFLGAATLPVTSHSYSQELQAVSDGDGPLSYVLGLYYYREKSNVRFGVYGPAINGALGVPLGPDVGTVDGGPAQVSSARLSVASIAPFGEATYAITPSLDFKVGARYTVEKKKLLSHAVTIENLGPPIVLLDEPQRELKFNEFTPKATLSYKIDGNTLVYATYSKGFKSGGLNSVQFTPLDAVEPEIITDYDVGLKWQNGWVRLSAAAFYYDYKNLQVSFVDSSTGASTTENAANAEIYGFEGDVSFTFSRAFSLNVTGGYLHARYKNYIGTAFVPSAGPIGGFDVVSADLSGNRVTQSPRFTGSVTGDYRHELSNGSTIGLNSTLSYSSSYFFDGANQVKEPGRVLLSANLSFTTENGRYRLDVFGDNLFNKKYRTAAQLNNYGGFYNPAPPVTWGVKGSMRY